MTGWLLVIVVALAAALTGLRAFARGAKKSPAPPASRPDQPPTPREQPLGREDIAAKLHQLATTTPPPTESRGAMCYDMSAPAPDQVKYVCPVDGTVVTFPADQASLAEDAIRIRAALPGLRRMGLDVSLDESDLCPKCRGSRKVDTPKLALIIAYPKGAQAHRVEGVSSADVTLLREFLQGKGEHRLEGPDTAPLRDSLPRLRELLGVPATTDLSRDELNRRLKALPAKPDKPLEMGAMCYRTALPPQTNDYVCPLDGQRTHYTNGQHGMLLARELPAMRAALESIKAATPGIQVTLDESELCRRCQPHVKEPKITLVVRLADGSEKRTRDVSARDMEILDAFLRGRTVHEGRTGQQTLLKDDEKRIRELLGL